MLFIFRATVLILTKLCLLWNWSCASSTWWTAVLRVTNVRTCIPSFLANSIILVLPVPWETIASFHTERHFQKVRLPNFHKITWTTSCRNLHAFCQLFSGLKQILFKHIETAPRDILGGFPRISREEALDMIDVTQCKLREQQGDVGKEEPKGGIPSLFEINVPIPPELMQGFDG